MEGKKDTFFGFTTTHSRFKNSDHDGEFNEEEQVSHASVYVVLFMVLLCHCLCDL